MSSENAVFSSAVLLEELAGVLERGEFSAALASRDLTPALLTRRYGAVTTLVGPMPVDRAVPADADDDHVIGAALGARADAIATSIETCWTWIRTAESGFSLRQRYWSS